MQRAQSPELNGWDMKDNNVLGSPSLGPAPPPINNNRNIRSPHLAPQNRPSSPAFALPSSPNGNGRSGGHLAGEAMSWMRTLKSKSLSFHFCISFHKDCP
jgi:hypothetical protein